jgi:hypothetical protein
MGDALREPPRIHEHERRVVGLDQLRQSIVDLAPGLARHHGFEWRREHLHREVGRSLVALVDDRAVGRLAGRTAAAPDQEASDILDRPLGRRQADALEPAAGHVVEPLE